MWKLFILLMLTGINKIVDLKVKPYAHKNCGKAFSCSCDRNRSETLHTSQQPNVCNHCQKAFTRFTQYKSITIPLDRNFLYINMVSKLFLCSCHFNKHKDLTQCLYCGKVFSTSSFCNPHAQIYPGKNCNEYIHLSIVPSLQEFLMP